MNVLFMIITTLATILIYAIATIINNRITHATVRTVVNPLVITTLIAIMFLQATGISASSFQEATLPISILLGPATTALGISIYRQRAILQRNFLPVIVGCTVGSAVSMASAYGLCLAFGLGDTIAKSMVAKSVTTPIAMAVSTQLGANVAITVAAVIFTGIMGAIFAPSLVKLFHIKNPVATGLAIGSCSHAMGTSKALEIGQLEGALSSTAIAVSGLMTTFIALGYVTFFG